MRGPHKGFSSPYISLRSVDTGPILAQEKVLRLPNDTIELFEERIHQTEHMLYKSTLKKLFAENKKNK